MLRPALVAIILAIAWLPAASAASPPVDPCSTAPELCYQCPAYGILCGLHPRICDLFNEPIARICRGNVSGIVDPHL